MRYSYLRRKRQQFNRWWRLCAYCSAGFQARSLDWQWQFKDSVTQRAFKEVFEAKYFEDEECHLFVISSKHSEKYW